MALRIRRTAALLATGILATAALGACGGPEDDAADGGSSQSTAQDGGASASDAGGTGSDAGGASDGGSDGFDAGGSSASDASDGGDDSAGGSATVSSQPAADADLREVDFPVDAQKAVDTAVDEAGDGTVHAVELDHDSKDDAWQYDVKILVGEQDHEVTIDAVSGKVVHSEQEHTDDAEKAVDLSDPMTFEQALEAASAKADGPLRSWKLEWDDGHRAYQFDIGSQDETDEVTVDVDSGSVSVDAD